MYASSSTGLPQQRNRNSWKAALVSVNAPASVKRSWSIDAVDASARIRNSTSCASVSRPMVSSSAPSSSAMRASNWASDSVTGGCSSPIS